MKIAALKISTFRGMSIGAEHWYGKIGYREPFRQRWSSDDPRFKDVEVVEPMTQAQADILTEKDGYNWQAGDPNSRFDAIFDLDKVAIPLFEQHFDPTEDLLIRMYDTGQWKHDRFRRVLAGKPHIVAQFAALGEEDYLDRPYLTEEERASMGRLSEELGINAMMYW